MYKKSEQQIIRSIKISNYALAVVNTAILVLCLYIGLIIIKITASVMADIELFSLIKPLSHSEFINKIMTLVAVIIIYFIIKKWLTHNIKKDLTKLTPHVARDTYKKLNLNTDIRIWYAKYLKDFVSNEVEKMQKD